MPPPEKGDEPGKLSPLMSGRHGLSAEEVSHSQRERLMAALVSLLAESDYGELRIAEITARASVSNSAFYENFADLQTCFLASFDALADHLQGILTISWGSQARWPERVFAALGAALSFLDENPAAARLLFLVPFTATPAIAGHFQRRLESVQPFLAQGRELGGGALSETSESLVLGGLATRLSGSIDAGSGPLFALLPELATFVLSPYLGAEESARRVARSTPRSSE